VQFLMGLRNPRAHRELMAYGLTREVLEEGQNLLLMNLDAFENQWFPIAKVVLSRHFPDVSEWLFNNLGQTQGIDLVVGVDAFVSRIRELDAGTSPFADRGKQAIALLRGRGFSVDVQAAVEALIQRITEFDSTPAVPVDTKEESKNVAALWAWYLEWSGIARTVIKDRRVLKSLGFLRPKSAQTEEEEDAVDPATADTEEVEVSRAS
jgi:hypothetical protein